MAQSWKCKLPPEHALSHPAPKGPIMMSSAACQQCHHWHALAHRYTAVQSQAAANWHGVAHWQAVALWQAAAHWRAPAHWQAAASGKQLTIGKQLPTGMHLIIDMQLGNSKASSHADLLTP